MFAFFAQSYCIKFQLYSYCSGSKDVDKAFFLLSQPDLAMSIANVIHEITMNERVDGEGNNGIKEHVKTLLEG